MAVMVVLGSGSRNPMGGLNSFQQFPTVVAVLGAPV